MFWILKIYQLFKPNSFVCNLKQLSVQILEPICGLCQMWHWWQLSNTQSLNFKVPHPGVVFVSWMLPAGVIHLFWMEKVMTASSFILLSFRTSKISASLLFLLVSFSYFSLTDTSTFLNSVFNLILKKDPIINFLNELIPVKRKSKNLKLFWFR